MTTDTVVQPCSLARATISVVLYKNPHVEERCLQRIRECTEQGSYLLDVRDNTHNNLPLSMVWNSVLEYAITPYLVLLNTDAFVSPGWLEKLVDVLDNHPAAAAAGPSVSRCGTRQSRWPPGVINYLHSTELQGPLPQAYNKKATNADIDRIGKAFADFDWEKACGGRLIQSHLSGCCLALRVEDVIQVGGFDERIDTFYGQDTEMIHRLLDSGFETLHVRDAYVHHLGGATRQKREAEEGFDHEGDRRRAVALVRQLREDRSRRPFHRRNSKAMTSKPQDPPEGPNGDQHSP